MAKTNPYNSRQTPSLAFDDEEPLASPRPAPRTRTRAAASDPDARRGRESAPSREESLYADDERPLRNRRAPIRQSLGPAFTWTRFLFRTRIGLALLAFALIAAAVLLVLAYRRLRSFVEADPHFRVASSSSIQIIGAEDADSGGLTRADLLSVFASDLGRNIFFVPLKKRQAELEQLPWVAAATVMRLLPDRLSVAVAERSPVAFVRLGNRIGLVDANGVLLTLPPAILAARHYSFPVVAGLAPGDAPGAPEARAERMRLYTRFIAELDTPISSQTTSAAHPQAAPQPTTPISSQLSEVDLSDPEDVRALVPAQGSDILLHFGDSDFLTRYRNYQAHLTEWRQQYPHLSAIDLRYDRQVVLKMADGAESEAGSIDNPTHANTLTAAPPTAPRHFPVPSVHPPHRPAGHGAAHGWRPR